MNLFLAGIGRAAVDPEPARRALVELLAEFPFLDPSAIRTWRSPAGRTAAVSVAHAEEVTGGADYARFAPDRALMFAGRPVRWTGSAAADGTGPLDPSSYADPAADWADELDGRFTVLCADDGSLTLVTDPLGAYPMFELRSAGATWFSNNPEVLQRIGGEDAIDEEALAGVLGGGWSLGGHPVWRSVRRVDRGVVLRLAPDGTRERRELLPLNGIIDHVGGPLDVAGAAERLVALTGALACWPGRPDAVPVTGGRDSRVVLAAAIAAGFPFEACTGGAPTDPDVVIGARLCELSGLEHHRLGADPHGDRFSRLQRAARLTFLASGGTATLQDAAGYPLGPRPGPLPIWHSGQGGEIARGYFGVGGSATSERLYARFVGRRPGRTEIVSSDAAAVLRRRIDGFVSEMRDHGADTEDVPDLFYLLERMACWAAPSHGMVELIRDTTSPLWSARMLPYLLALPARERALEAFHHRVLQHLAPELVGEPFQDGSGWPADQSALGRRIARARVLGGKVRAEAVRRVAGRRRRSPSSSTPVSARPTAAVDAVPPAPDPFEPILAAVREAAHGLPAHPAWAVLDRPRVQRLLSSHSVELDEMSRMYIWRLASAFLGM